MSTFMRPRRHRGAPVSLRSRVELYWPLARGVLASFSGTLTGAHAQADIPITISRADFTLASGHVLLELDMETPDRLRIVPDGRASVPTLANEDGMGYRLVELSSGTYTLEVSASGRAGQPYRIAVSLAGDTAGAFQVNSQDLATIRALKGQHRGEPSYLIAADVNHDGAINTRDVRLAVPNMGVATSIRPLAVTLGLGPSTRTTASGAVYQPSVIVAGQTEPAATVSLYGAGAGSASMTLSNDPSLVAAASRLTTTADSLGHYQFTLNAAVGANTLHVVASDAFGQQSSAALSVTHVVDTQPPTIAIQTPTAGLTTNADVLVSGRVTDDLSGVAALQEQVDSGPVMPVAVDSSGNFAFAATLPENGSADGMHTVRLRAVDGAGNVFEASASFGLDTAGPTITITAPGPNATVHASSVVTGQAGDNLAGVATVVAQVDSGALQAVVVDSAGNFSVPTGLPADGSADGTHTVQIRAFDRAGNVTSSSVTFLLASYGLNQAITTNSGVQQQPSIATDPRDPNHLVTAYMDYSLLTTGYAGIGVAVSHDAGVTWQYTSLALPAGFDQGATNPIVRFDSQGHVFVSFMAATFLGPLPPLTNPSGNDPDTGNTYRSDGLQANNGIFVARSDDGGATWEIPVAIVSHLYQGRLVPFEIIPDLAVDTFPDLPDGTPNPNYGNLYACWSRYYPPGEFPGQPASTGGSNIIFALSRDGGRTWQTQSGTGLEVLTGRGVSGGGVPSGLGNENWSHLSIGPDGDIYLAHYGGGTFDVYHSTDLGKSFTSSTAFGFGSTALPANLLHDNLRVQPARAIAADPTRPGVVYAMDEVQNVDAAGNVIDPDDLVFARSTDSGVTWQTTFKIGTQPASVLNDDNGGQPATGATGDVTSGQIFPRIATDAQGDVAVIWYDTRTDPANDSLSVFGTVSTDGGQTFSPNFPVTTTNFDPNAGKFSDAIRNTDFYLGDFLGLTLANGTGYANWSDTRNGNQDIFFSRFPLNPAPAALNDRYEPNDTPATAADVGPVVSDQLPRLALPAGDQDWFRVQATATGSLTVSATATAAAVGPGLALELWDASGTTRLAQGTVLTNEQGGIIGQQVVYPGNSGQTYLVHVVSVGGGARSYSLQVQSLTADLGPLVHGTVTGSVTGGAQSYYLVSAGAAGSVEVALTGAADLQGNLSLELRDPSTLAVLATGQSSGVGGAGSVVMASLAVTQGQSLLLHVAGDAAAQGHFTLELTNLDQFTTARNASLLFPAGNGPSEEAVGDLNGDGDLDVVVADALSNTVSVLLGNGDGTFQAPRQFAIGVYVADPITKDSVVPTNPRQVLIADINGDHLPDLIVINPDSSDVSVLLGRGDGTFDPQRRFDATAMPIAVGVGDFNGDGNLDLAVVDNSSGPQDLAILLGHGNGTFSPPHLLSVPIQGVLLNARLEVADMNGDGKADIVEDDSVLLGNGDGTFRLSASVTAAITAVADINGDGKLDLIAYDLPTNAVFYALGNGDGTFQPQQTMFAGQSPLAVTVADIGSEIDNSDGTRSLGPPDGHPDLIVADTGVANNLATGPPEVVVLSGMVDDQGLFAGFGVPITLSAAQTPQAVVVADVNHDSVLDVVASDAGGTRVIFGRPPTIPPNDTLQTARNLGTVVHVVEPTLTIVPGHEDAYYTFAVPTETAHGAGDEVIDFSGLFQATAGAGLAMEVDDAEGNMLGSGERFRVSAPQGAELTLHVFAATAADGTRGAGAYTFDIDVLPQVVSVEAQTLLPGQGGLPGGATASLVVTLQGDRLDPTTAQNAANYTVTWLGPDGKAGTADDQVIPLAANFQSVVYDPSANLDVSSGTIHPTALRQTVTLLFANPLPAGSYEVTLASPIQAAAYSTGETGLLTGAAAFNGHPVVRLMNGQITNGSTVTATDQVLQSGALGDLNTLKGGNAFLTQLHDDLSALLDHKLTQLGTKPTITPALIDQVLNRLEGGLGAPGHRTTTAVALIFDPVSIGVDDPDGDTIDYDLGTGDLTDTTMDSYVDVDGNIEVVILFDPFMDVLSSDLTDILVDVSDVPPDASAGVIVLGEDGDTTMDLTDDLSAGMTQFDIPPPD